MVYLDISYPRSSAGILQGELGLTTHTHTVQPRHWETGAVGGAAAQIVFYSSISIRMHTVISGTGNQTV